MRELIITADDFGLSEAVNEGVERAHREGILNTASLMIAGPAAADAVRRARLMPDLRVGLHVVVIEGRAALPGICPSLIDHAGWFPSDPLHVGVHYAISRSARRQLRAEIAAQFRAFRGTGLALDHANAHKHLHLHPVVARGIIDAGAEFGLRAMRIPSEPPATLLACGDRPGRTAQVLYRWTRVLRAQATRAGLRVNDHVFGLAWSGHMIAERLLTLAPHLPDGLTELYFHPAAWRDSRLDQFMPEYEHEAELAALTSPHVREALMKVGAVPATFT